MALLTAAMISMLSMLLSALVKYRRRPFPATGVSREEEWLLLAQGNASHCNRQTDRQWAEAEALSHTPMGNLLAKAVLINQRPPDK